MTNEESVTDGYILYNQNTIIINIYFFTINKLFELKWHE